MINIYTNTINNYIESSFDTAKRSLRPCLIYLCLVDSHLQPARISNKSPAIFLQAGLEAVPDWNKLTIVLSGH